MYAHTHNDVSDILSFVHIHMHMYIIMSQGHVYHHVSRFSIHGSVFFDTENEVIVDYLRRQKLDQASVGSKGSHDVANDGFSFPSYM